MVGLLIKSIGLSDYFFVVNTKNEYNTTGRTELHSLNSDHPVAVGTFKCLQAVFEYKRGA